MKATSLISTSESMQVKILRLLHNSFVGSKYELNALVSIFRGYS